MNTSVPRGLNMTRISKDFFSSTCNSITDYSQAHPSWKRTPGSFLRTHQCPDCGGDVWPGVIHACIGQKPETVDNDRQDKTQKAIDVLRILIKKSLIKKPSASAIQELFDLIEKIKEIL